MPLNVNRGNDKKGSFVRGVNDNSANVGEVDVVPMINVVFLLLIFFMVVGVFRAAVDNAFVFPTASERDENRSQNPDPQVVINQQGEFLINAQPVARANVLAALQQLAKKDLLLLQADANAPANDILFVLQLATAAGFTNAGLQTIRQPTSAVR